MTIVRHKDGHPNVKFFESIETLNQFDTIRKALQKKDLKKIFGDDQHHLTKETIAQLVIQLLHFQEDHFGKQSNGSAPVIRIPVRIKKTKRIFFSYLYLTIFRWNVFWIFVNQVHFIQLFLVVTNIKTIIIGNKKKQILTKKNFFFFY
jgi:hypothetical protein